MRRAHYLQHVPFEGPGALQPWLVEQGWALTCTRSYLGENLPSLDGIDFVIVLGGPMGVHEDAVHSWIARERAFIAEALQRELAVLGVCLGAQLMASALGARVYPGARKEIGWFPVFGRETTAPDFRFPRECLAFHWHGDTFDLPEGARLLASSETYEHQAFQAGPYAVGVQFHLESTRGSLEELIEHGRDELVEAEGVQSERELRGVGDESFASLHETMGDLLVYLLRDTR